HKQQLEDHHRQPETIVLLPSIYVSKRHALQFWRRIFWKPSLTTIGLAFDRNLETVDIEQINRSLMSDQDVFRVQVAYHQSVFVDGHYCSGDIGGNVDQKHPRSFGEFLEPTLRTVERVNLFGLADLLHHEANDISVRSVEQRSDRP